MFDKTKEPTNGGVGSNSRNSSPFGEKTQLGSATNESQSTGTFGATIKNSTNRSGSNGNFEMSFKPFAQPQQNTSLFGAAQPQANSTSLVGQPAATSAFGAAVKPGGLGGFGQTATQPTTSLFAQPANAAAAANPGTSIAKYVTTIGTDTLMKGGQPNNVNTKQHHITAMKEYEGKSLEELRMEDYLANRKGPQTGTTTGLGFAPDGNDVVQNGNYGLRRLSTNSSKLQQANAAAAANPGTSIAKYVTTIGTDILMEGGQPHNINTKQHCITAMKEYEGKSLEELRMEDYLANRKGPQTGTTTGLGFAPDGNDVVQNGNYGLRRLSTNSSKLQQSNIFGSTTTTSNRFGSLSSTQNDDDLAKYGLRRLTTTTTSNRFGSLSSTQNDDDLAKYGLRRLTTTTTSNRFGSLSSTQNDDDLAKYGLRRLTTTTTSNRFGYLSSTQNDDDLAKYGLRRLTTNSILNRYKPIQTPLAKSFSQTPAVTKNEKNAASSELYGGARASNNVSQMPLPTDNGTETEIKSDTQRNTEAAKTCSQTSLVPNNNTSDIETNTGKTSNSTAGVNGSTSEEEALRNFSHIPFLNSARATGVTSKSPKENVIATNNANNYSDSESANSTTIPQNEVDATELSFSMLHIPPFSIENPEEWFTYVESQFAAASIVGDFIKYRTVLNAIKNNSLLKISDAEIPPPNNTSDKYGQLKRKILLKCNRQNLTIKALKNLELGEMTPTQLLNKMRIMGGIDINDDIIKPIWMNCLPFEVQNIISISSDDLSTLAVMADKIMALIRGISHTSTFALTSSEPRTYPHSSLELQISLLTKEIADLKMKVAERPAQ